MQCVIIESNSMVIDKKGIDVIYKATPKSFEEIFLCQYCIKLHSHSNLQHYVA